MTWEDIDTAYRRLYLENYLSTWSERLVEYGEYELPARQSLKLLATLPEDIEREGMLNILMTGQDASKIEAVDYTLSKVLECIMKKDALRIFRSPLLRDYWFDRFV